MADVLLSTLTGSTGGVKLIQTAYVDNQATSTSTGEDVRYKDITLGTAVVAANCVCFFQGSSSNTSGTNALYSATADQGVVTARMTTTTNLRLATRHAHGFISGRYYVVEYE